MRKWLLLSIAVVVVFLSAWVARKPAGEPTGTSAAELADLRAEVARLKQRVTMGERATLSLAVKSQTPSDSNRVAGNEPLPQARSDDSNSAMELDPEPTEVQRRPRVEQQMARFKKHFANLDELRGTQPDLPLERKVRGLLTSPEAAKLPILSKASVDRVECGNELCRLDVTFNDPAFARLGQTEVQIQLGPLTRGATMYMEPGSAQLHAYFATGETPIPAFPASEEAPAGQGG